MNVELSPDTINKLKFFFGERRLNRLRNRLRKDIGYEKLHSREY
jgi:hypothetical protein